jgi:hypothetical protein
VARNDLAQVVLGQQIDGEVVLQNGDILMLANSLNEGTLDLGTRQVLMVKDAVLGVTTLTVQIKATILSLVETHTPTYKFCCRLGSLTHNDLHSLAIAATGAANKRIFDMLLEGIGLVGNRADSSLCIVSITLDKFTLCNYGNVSVLCGLQSKAQTGRAGADNQKIGLHNISIIRWRKDMNFYAILNSYYPQ